jgi:hypothetical protein
VNAVACVIVTCDGPAVCVVDERLLRRRTRRIGEVRLAEICEALRTAAAQDRRDR